MPSCSHCGEPAPSGSFCRRCGAAISRESTSAPTSDHERSEGHPNGTAVAPGPSGPNGAPPKSRRFIVLVAVLAVVTVAMVVLAVVVVVSPKHSSPHSVSPPPEPSSVSTESTTADNVSAAADAPSSTDSPTTAPTSTTVALTPQQKTTLAAVQSLATDLADHDWNAAREHPAFANTPDADLNSSYGGLRQSIATVVSATPVAGNSVDARVGLVAWEDVGAGPRTNVYCVTWTVDLGLAKVTASRDFVRLTPTSIPGFVDPTTQIALIRSGC